MEYQADSQKDTSETDRNTGRHTMTRNEEIRSIITVKLQAIQVIHETAHERIIANMEDFKKLTGELVEIENGSIVNETITL